MNLREDAAVDVLEHGPYYKLVDGEAVEISFDSTGVLKHGSHNQKDHAGKTGTAITPPNPAKGEDQSVTYRGLYVEVAVPRFDGTGRDDARIQAHPQAMKEAGEAFGYWNDNYSIRVASAHMMGLQGGFSPKGEIGEKYVNAFLRGEVKNAADLDPFDADKATTKIRHAVTLMDATAKGAPQPTLYRGVRLKEDDPRLSAKVGDEFEMPVSAFATGRADAEAFASTGSVSGIGPSAQNSNPVLIEVRSGSRGFRTGDLPNGGEVLTQGRFRVVEDITDEDFPARLGGGKIRRLALEQVARYDIMSGQWIES
jgi:hypothetical protein